MSAASQQTQKEVVETTGGSGDTRRLQQESHLLIHNQGVAGYWEPYQTEAAVAVFTRRSTLISNAGGT